MRFSEKRTLPKRKEFSNLDKATILKERISEWSHRRSGALIGIRHSTMIRICKVKQKAGFSSKLTRCG